MTYEEYKELRKNAKDNVLKAKSKAWENFGLKMKENFIGNQKLFYRVVRNISKKNGNGINYINDKNGQLLTNKEEIMERNILRSF